MRATQVVRCVASELASSFDKLRTRPEDKRLMLSLSKHELIEA
jgi:hypothetical protein